MPTQEANEDKLKFEEALAKLETIVNEMESGELSLEESMKKFEQGMELSKLCTDKLGETEKKIELLLKKAEQGPQWQPMESPQ